MKIIHRAQTHRQRNHMAVHVDKQVFYKSLRGVHAEDKMLLYAREAVYPGIEMDPLGGQSFPENEQNYSCPICGEMFRSKLAVLRHKACICTNPIATYNNLKEQMTLNHHNMACSNISATRNSNSNGNHIGNCSESDDSKSDESCQEPAEPGSGGVFKCDECPKSFHWKANLQRHLLTHAGNRKFQCENCDKLFTDPSNLQRHIRSQHVGARSHACSDCGKTFATSSGLKQHQHIHSSIKPFQCEVCLKAYTQFSNLCRHKRMHADCRQQIKCTDCGQAFSTVTSLSKHRRFCEGVTGIASPVFSNDHAPHLNSSLFTLYAAAAAASRPQFSLSSFHQMSVYQNLWAQRLPRMLGMSPVSSSGPLKLTANTTRLSPGNYLHPSHETSIKGPKTCNFLPYLDQQENSGRNSAVSDDDNDDDDGDDDDDDISEDTSELDVSKTSDDGGEGHKYLKRTLEDPQASSRPESPNLENVTKVPKSEAGQTLQEIKHRSGNSFAPPGSTHFRPQSPEASFIDGPANSKFQSVFSGRPDKSPALSSDDLKPEHDSSSSSSSSMKTLKNDVSEVSSDSYFSHKDEVPLDLSKKPVNLTPVPRAEPQRLSQTYSEKSPSPSSSSSSSSLSPTTPFFKPHITSVSAHSLPSLSIPGLKTNIPDSLNYPFSPIFLESLLRMKEGMKLQQEAAANYSDPFTSFPVPGPSMFPGLHSQYGIPSNPDLDKVLSPTKSYESSNHAVRHQGHLHAYFGQGTQNASKEKYSCKFCGKIFPRSANLTRHLRTHTGEQPYKCKYCERSFSISSNLQRHVRNIHNKEKPFRCQLCDRCFGQQTNLDRHLKKHELDSPSLSDSTTADLDPRNTVRVSGSFAGSSNRVEDDDAGNEKEVSDIVSKGIPSSYTDNSSSNRKQLFNKDIVYADEENEVIEGEDICEVTMTR